MTMQETAAAYRKLFVYKENEAIDFKGYVFADGVISEHPLYDGISDVIRKMDCGTNFAYDICVRALDAIVENHADDITDEAPSYNYQILKWIGEDNWHLSATNDQIEEGCKDLIQAAQWAWERMFEDLARDVVRFIEEKSNESEE